MFDWTDDSTNRVSSQFWIYWLDTIPLTTLVILAWQWWTGGLAMRVWWRRTRKIKPPDFAV